MCEFITYEALVVYIFLIEEDKWEWKHKNKTNEGHFYHDKVTLCVIVRNYLRWKPVWMIDELREWMDQKCK